MPLKNRLTLLMLAASVFAGLSASGQIRPDVTRPAVKPAAPTSSTTNKTQIVIQTVPRAQVYLDDIFKGQASSQGRLVIDNPQPGDHALRVSLNGKQDYEQSVTVVAKKVINLTVSLRDFSGTVLVQTSPGAAVFLDDSSRGTTDASGKASIPEVAVGSHELRITAPGKSEYRQSITVSAGQATKVEAPLANSTGTVAVQTSPGAAIFLDNSNRGTTDATGRLLVHDLAAGAHELRITAPGKGEYRGNVTVSAGKEAAVDGALVDIGPAPEEVALWKKIENVCNIDEYRNYLNQYPSGAFANEAKSRSREVEESKRQLAERLTSALGGAETTERYGKIVIPLSTGNVNAGQGQANPTGSVAAFFNLPAEGVSPNSPGCKMKMETTEIFLETFKGQPAISFPAAYYCVPGWQVVASYGLASGQYQVCGEGRIYITDDSVAFQQNTGKVQFVFARSGATLNKDGGSGWKERISFNIADAKGPRRRFGSIPYESQYRMFLQMAISGFPEAYRQAQQLPAKHD